jgi:hypothetical protein
MKERIKIAMIFSPIVLLSGQVLSNLLYMGLPDIYIKLYPILGTFFGFNMIAAILMTSMTYYFNFCKVSRAAAICQIIFGVFYMIFPDKEVYNLLIQVLVGIAALLVTFINFVMQYQVQWKQQKL